MWWHIEYRHEPRSVPYMWAHEMLILLVMTVERTEASRI
jgi:hypothetical protein